jgi:2-deoxy-D-gluconate 3-dehydrogenase
MALGLARAGASVAVLARNPQENQIAELTRIGGRTLMLSVDVTDRPALAPAVAEIERALGGIDILVNNAGIVAQTAGVLNETADEWDDTIETHLNATFLLSQLVARSMVKRKSGGKIINLASMYSIFGSSRVPSYSAAKGGVVQLTKSLAIELAPHDIQVNAIAPGWIETDMTAAIRSSPMNDEILARTPAKRWGKSDELIGATVFLASRGADFITGATLPVDGGYSIY